MTVAQAMESVLSDLRNTYWQASVSADTSWFIFGGADEAERALTTASKSIDYLAGDGRDAVNSGAKSFADWMDLAKTTRGLIAELAGFTGEWQLSNVAAEVALGTGSAIAGGLEKAADTAKAAAWPVAIIAVAAVAGYLLLARRAA